MMRCPGMTYYQLIHAHGLCQQIFLGNVRDLRRMLKQLQNPDEALRVFDLDNRDKRPLVQGEVVRLFHNFAAAAMTLVEHTRILMRHEAIAAAHRNEYEEKVGERFARDPLAGFVQDLRNYFLHRGIPAAGMSLKIVLGNKDVEASVFLDLTSMKDWDGWRARSREFMSQSPDRLSLLAIIDEYAEKVRAFHAWFVEWFIQGYSRELAELRELEREWNGGLRQNPPRQ